MENNTNETILYDSNNSGNSYTAEEITYSIYQICCVVCLSIIVFQLFKFLKSTCRPKR